jgi:hypothetical protein
MTTKFKNTTSSKSTPAAVEGVGQDGYLPARKVWERYGVTSMTLSRWLRNERIGFPEPTYFGRFRYWRLCDLLAWERACAKRSASDV